MPLFATVEPSIVVVWRTQAVLLFATSEPPVAFWVIRAV